MAVNKETESDQRTGDYGSDPSSSAKLSLQKGQKNGSCNSKRSPERPKFTYQHAYP